MPCGSRSLHLRPPRRSPPGGGGTAASQRQSPARPGRMSLTTLLGTDSEWNPPAMPFGGQGQRNELLGPDLGPPATSRLRSRRLRLLSALSEIMRLKQGLKVTYTRGPTCSFNLPQRRRTPPLLTRIFYWSPARRHRPRRRGLHTCIAARQKGAKCLVCVCSSQRLSKRLLQSWACGWLLQYWTRDFWRGHGKSVCGAKLNI